VTATRGKPDRSDIRRGLHIPKQLLLWHFICVINIFLKMVVSETLVLHKIFPVFLLLVLLSYFATLTELENHESTLHKALRKYQFTDATLISVGISSQVAIHLFLETFSFTRNPKLLMVFRWSVNIAYTAVNMTYWITLRCDAITVGLYLMLQYILMSLMCFTLVSSLNSIDSDIWTLKKSLAIGVLVTLYYIFTFHNKRVLSFSSVLGILAFISYSSAALLLFSCAYTWYTKYLYKRKFAELELKEKVCFIRMCSLVMLLSSVVFVSVFYGETKLEDLDVTYATAFSYAISGNNIMFSTAYARKLHLEAAQVSVSPRCK